MKKMDLIFAFQLICFSASADEIEFVKPKGGAGRIQIVQGTFHQNGMGIDINGKARIRYGSWSYEDAGGYEYQIYPEAGDGRQIIPISNVTISEKQYKTLKSILGNASNRCPVTIVLDEDYKIKKVDANCK